MSNTISTINITKFNEIYTGKSILLCIFYIEPPVTKPIMIKNQPTPRYHTAITPGIQTSGIKTLIKICLTNKTHPKWYVYCIWVFPKMGVPQNRLFIMENPIKMHDLGVPLFSETSISMNLEDHPSLPRTCKWLITPKWPGFHGGVIDHSSTWNLKMAFPSPGDSVVRAWNFTINCWGSMFGNSGNVSILERNDSYHNHPHKKKWEVTWPLDDFYAFKKNCFWGSRLVFDWIPQRKLTVLPTRDRGSLR